jgi:hypothetical protein
MEKIEIIKNKLVSAKAQKETIQESILKKGEQLKRLKKELFYCEKAMAIVQKVSLQTQQEFEYRFSEIVSLQLDIVFDNPYFFHIEFVETKRGIETKMFLERDGKKYSRVIGAVGGGVIDVIAFALQAALWKMKVNKSRNTILLDEPFHNLRGKKEQERLWMVLTELSEKFGLQFIVITPKNFEVENGKIFHVEKRGQKSVMMEQSV